IILSIKFQTILKIISHYFQNQSSPLKKTKDLRIRSPRIGQNNAEIGLAQETCSPASRRTGESLDAGPRAFTAELSSFTTARQGAVREVSKSLRALSKSRAQAEKREEEGGCGDYEKGDGQRAADEDRKVSLGNDQGLTQVVFEHGSQNQGQDQRGRLELELLQQKAKDSEEPHDDHVADVVVETVRADETEEQNHRVKNPVGNLEHLHPEGDQREIQNQQHDVADVHRGDESPKDIRMLIDQQRAGLNAVNRQGAQKHRHDGVGGNPQRKHRHKVAA